MANGKTFEEIRQVVEDEKDLPVKVTLRLILAGMADMHDNDETYRVETTERLKKIEDVTKYPSAMWYIVNKTGKAFIFFAFVVLFMVLAFVPEARGWAWATIIKSIF